MRHFKHLLRASLICSLLLMNIADLVFASKGTPNSATFGYGAAVNLQENQPEQAVQLAKQIALDWLTLPVSWQEIQPNSTSSPDWSSIQSVIHEAAKNQISIMIQIKDAPAWAISSTGPDPQKTADFVEALAAQFWPSIQAVEIFPGANTVLGWGTKPDAAAYIQVIKSVKERLIQKNCSLYLVAGGINLLSTSDTPAKDFLSELYASGLSGVTDILSLQIQIDPDFQNKERGNRTAILQWMEEIHQIMLDNGHTNGVIWITQLEGPSGTITLSGQEILDLCRQIRSRLYIGTLFFGNLDLKDKLAPGDVNTRFCVKDEPDFSSPTAIVQELIFENNGGCSKTGI
jgi:hypothetical protein